MKSMRNLKTKLEECEDLQYCPFTSENIIQRAFYACHSCHNNTHFSVLVTVKCKFYTLGFP